MIALLFCALLAQAGAVHDANVMDNGGADGGAAAGADGGAAAGADGGVAAPKSTPDAPFRALPPAPSEAAVFHAPVPQDIALQNGLHIYLIERHEVPLVTVTLAVRSGADSEPQGKSGLASLTLDMLDEGAAGKDAASIARTFENLAVRYSTGADADASSVTLVALPDALDAALDLFADVVLRPSFHEDDLKRVKQVRMGQIAQALDDPAAVGQHVLSRVLFGEKHPWGYPAEGTVKSIPALRGADLRAWYNAAFRPSNAAIFIVGDLSAVRVKPLFEHRFQVWKDGPAPKARVEKVPEPSAARVIDLIDKPDAPQSQIWIGEVGVSSTAPDIFPVRVMNHILGGGFTSRLNGNLRTEHAYSYGVASYFEPHREAGPFVAEGAVESSKTADALGEFLRELTKMQSGEVSDAELAEAKEALEHSVPAHFERNEEMAAEYAAAWSHGLPIDYFAHYQERIRAVSKEEVGKAARERLHPAQMAIVIVGPAAQLAPELSKLPFGKVDLRDADGEALKATRAAAH